jgi:hypothetical protein
VIVLAAAKGHATTAASSIDPYGWAQDFVGPCLNPTGPVEHCFLYQVARAQSIIVSAKFPPSVGLILTAGLSTPLYKDSANARDELRAKGETEMRLRPTVSGSMFLKHTLQEVNKTSAGKRVFEILRKHNKALGVKGGLEQVAWEARAQRANGGCIGTNDNVNCFNEFLREALMTGLSELWPESTSL